MVGRPDRCELRRHDVSCASMRLRGTLIILLASIAASISHPIASAGLFEPAAQFVTLGGKYDDAITDVAIAPDGTRVLCGAFSGPVDFDLTGNSHEMTSVRSSDAFVTCCKSDGAFLWSAQLGGRGQDHASAVAFASDGSVFVVGRFVLEMKLDVSAEPKSRLSVGKGDAFIAKYSNDGKLRWVVTLGGQDGDAAIDVAADAVGGCYVVGQVTDAVDIDTRQGSMIVDPRGGSDAFLLHLDTNGEYQFGTIIGAGGNDVGLGVAQVGERVFVSGNFGSTMSLAGGRIQDVLSDPTTAPVTTMPTTGATTVGSALSVTSAGKLDAFVATYSLDGKPLSINSIGGPGLDLAATGSIAVCDDRVAVAGQFEKTATLGDLKLKSNGAVDAFVSFFDREGKPVHAIALGGARNESAVRVAFDDKGTLCVAGVAAGVVDIDPTEATKHVKPSSAKPIGFLATYGRDYKPITFTSFHSGERVLRELKAKIVTALRTKGWGSQPRVPVVAAFAPEIAGAVL